MDLKGIMLSEEDQLHINLRFHTAQFYNMQGFRDDTVIGMENILMAARV